MYMQMKKKRLNNAKLINLGIESIPFELVQNIAKKSLKD
jgi:hypothetical protein